MKVYKISGDSQNYQCFYYNEDKQYSFTNWLEFDGTPKKDTFPKDKKIFINNPEDKKGDFFAIGSELIISQNCLEIMLPILQPICEFIPFEYKNKTYHFINIRDKNIIDCIDYHKTEFRYLTIEGIKEISGIKRYVFDPKKFSQHSLFKESNFRHRIMIFEGVLENKEMEFKYRYDKFNLKGLCFDLIWDSEKE